MGKKALVNSSSWAYQITGRFCWGQFIGMLKEEITNYISADKEEAEEVVKISPLCLCFA